MEEGEGSIMNSHSENKSPPSQNPFLTMSDSMNDIPVGHQELLSSETPDLNPSGNPFLELDPSSLLSPAVLRDDGASNSLAEPVSRSASDCSDDDFPIRSTTTPESAIQNPPVQVMERAEDPESPSVYRIPSHVFDGTKSNNTPEWSAASNESLFSINVGPMSFSRELNWVSGETTALIPQSPVAPPPREAENGSLSPATKFKDISKRAGEFKEGDGVTEAKAAETMREVIMETTEDFDLASPVSVAPRLDGIGLSHLHDHARHSDASTKSFAFKVQAEGDKSSPRSARSGQEKQNLPAPHSNLRPKTESPRESPRAAQSPAASHTQNSSISNNNAPPSPRHPPPPPPPSTSSHSSSSKWLCCFACCK